MRPSKLANLIGNCAPLLPWTVGKVKMLPKFARQSAYVEIVGPDGFTYSDALRFGLYVQAPDSFYPPHNHAAEEFYSVLSGSAFWQRDNGEFRIMPPGSEIRHAAWQRHAMKTEIEPLLAMWVWTGDLSMATYSVDGE
jgi:mannose-6-phosphate isomerase-like protein (cupin superfamily)